MFLNCHSWFSYKYGTISIDNLLKLSIENGLNTIALTDINNGSGIWDFIRLASKYDFKPIVGIDFRNGNEQKYIGLAKNLKGIEELNRHLSLYIMNNKAFEKKCDYLENCQIIYPFNNDVFELRSNEFIGIKYTELKRLRFSDWMNQKGKLVILHPVTFNCKKDFNAHRLLRAIDLNVLLSKLPKNEQAEEWEMLKTEEELTDLFKDFPFLIENTKKLMTECSVSFEFKTIKNKKLFKGSKEEDTELMRRLSFEGAKKRYGILSDSIIQRIEKEIEIIAQKGYTSYFLIAWDIVMFAQKKGFFYVGRGSGANSIVAYCIQITDVDPMDLDLYFERFINLYRENPPDFDLDFSWKDRDEVIQHIFDTHGYEHTCLLATYNTFQAKSIIRELGKVFGLTLAEIEELIINYKKLEAESDYGKLIYKYAEYLHDFPSHLSIHAGGILISDAPIYQYTATNLPPKGFPTSQFDMLIAEDVGLYKFDILSQRGLGHIKEVVEIVKENQQIEIDIRAIEDFKKDEKIKELLKKGQAVGCFYVESPAMRMLLSKLKTETYLELVAASSIIRPGVARSGMMREYILRHRNVEMRKNIHPVMGEIMPETYGVMVYQEDVIKVAHHFGGLSLGEADALRRGMSGKFRSRDEFQKVKNKFYENCIQKGHETKLIDEVWYQIESFAGYSFAKGHSASYAVESYQSLFLKAYFPLEFMVGVINNFGGFYRTELYFHEARKNGAIIESICVNNSNYTTLIKGKTIFVGFIHLAHLEENTAKRIISERNENGDFEDLENFIYRVPISIQQIILLIRIGAFRFTEKSKSKMLWEAHFLVNKTEIKEHKNNLFYIKCQQKFDLPELIRDKREDALDEIELLGFPLSSPFELIDENYEEGILAKDLEKHLGETIQIIGYLITVKYTRTIKGATMNFGTFIDKEGNWIDTVHFPQIVEKFPFMGNGCYIIKGKVIEEFGFYSIEVNYLSKLKQWGIKF